MLAAVSILRDRAELLIPRIDRAVSRASAALRDRVDEQLTAPQLRAAERVSDLAHATSMRLDSIVNDLTGAGGANDKGTRSRPDINWKATRLTVAECRAIYRTSGYGRRYVDRLAGAMLAQGWKVTDGTQRIDVLRDEHRRLHTKTNLRRALEDAFVDGRSLLVLVTDEDPSEWSRPLSEGAEIRRLWALDTDEFEVLAVDDDPLSETFRRARAWSLHPSSSSLYALGAEVHASRCLYFGGRLVGDREWMLNGYTDDSLFQAPWDALRQLESVDSAHASLAHEMVTKVIKMGALASVDGGNDALMVALKNRIRGALMALGQLGVVLLAPDEEYQQITPQLSGVEHLRAASKEAWSAATGMPQTVAFGDAPSGLNTDGEAGKQQWHAVVTDMQESHLRAPLERLTGVLFAQGGVDEPPDWHLEWQALGTMTALETATLRKTVAEADVALVREGVLDPEEIRASRYGEQGWSADLLPVDPEPPMPEPIPAPLVPLAMPGAPVVPADDDDDDDELPAAE